MEVEKGWKQERRGYSGDGNMESRLLSVTVVVVGRRCRVLVWCGVVAGSSYGLRKSLWLSVSFLGAASDQLRRCVDLVDRERMAMWCREVRRETAVVVGWFYIRDRFR